MSDSNAVESSKKRSRPRQRNRRKRSEDVTPVRVNTVISATETEAMRRMAAIERLRTTLHNIAYTITDDDLAGSLFNIHAGADIVKLEKDTGFVKIFGLCDEYVRDMIGVILDVLMIGKHNRNTNLDVLVIIRNASEKLFKGTISTGVDQWITLVDTYRTSLRTQTRSLSSLYEMLSAFSAVCEASPNCYADIFNGLDVIVREKTTSSDELRFKCTICIYHMTEEGCKYESRKYECNYAHGYEDLCWPSLKE